MESMNENTATAEELQGAKSDQLAADLRTMLQRAGLKAKEQAKVADGLIRDYPYQTIGLAFGLGLLIGILARRK
jgi:ElaB/YqjD/DUF883 family membrane-anchored ribosome-binding protein